MGLASNIEDDGSAWAPDAAFDPGMLKATVAVNPPWSRVEGKYLLNFRGMLPDSGSILWGVHFWDVPFDDSAWAPDAAFDPAMLKTTVTPLSSKIATELGLASNVQHNWVLLVILNTIRSC